MQLEKVTTIEAYTTDGKSMIYGKTYVFTAHGKTNVGIYVGISTGRSSLMFEKPIYDSGDDKFFNIMPRSIGVIYESDLEIIKEGELESE